MTDTLSATTIVELYLDAVIPDDHNLRHELDMDVVDGIAETIPELGILEPLVVRPDGDRHVIIAGHHRHAAARLAGLDTVPCIVRDIDPSDTVAATLLMLVENLQRSDLTPVEEAEGYRRLADAGWDQKAISSAVGRSQPVVSKRLSLTHLPAEALTALQDKRLTVRQAEDLTKVDTDTVLELVGGQGAVKDWAITDAVAKAERAAKTAEAKKAVADAGVTEISPQDRWNADTNYVEAAEGEIPTHAVIDGYGRTTWLLVSTVDPDAEDDEQELDPAEAARREAWAARDAERQRRRDVWLAAADRHEATIRQALTNGTMPKEAVTYADRAIVALAADYLEVQVDEVCDFLELKYEVPDGPRWDGPRTGAKELADYAALSPRGAARAHLAVVAVEVLSLIRRCHASDDGDGLDPVLDVHYAFLAATGYQVPADEQAELDRITKPVADVEEQDDAA